MERKQRFPIKLIEDLKDTVLVNIYCLLLRIQMLKEMRLIKRIRNILSNVKDDNIVVIMRKTLMHLKDEEDRVSQWTLYGSRKKRGIIDSLRVVDVTLLCQCQQV